MASPNVIRGAAKAAQAFPAIRAYHGSPHDFDRFDARKIGTGEGAQTYGHGLYFAENPKVAEEYRARLAGVEPMQELIVAGRRLSPSNRWNYSPRNNSIEENVLSTLLENLMLDEQGLRAAGPRANELAIETLRSRSKHYPEEWPEAVEAAAALEKKMMAPGGVRVSFGKQPGAMYEVEIAQPRERLLDYDAPLKEQTPYVRERLARLDYFAPGVMQEARARGTGGGLMDTLLESYESTPAVGSKILREAGIPGVQYFDQLSRDLGDGTRNLVMFPGTEDSITILRKYGLLPAVGAGAAAAAGGNEAQAKPVLPESNRFIRSSVPWQTQNRYLRLNKQVDEAYARGDYKTAEKLDAQREQLLEDLDNKLEGLDEGDGNVDFEPEPYDAETSWTDELANIYGRAAVAKSQSYAVENDADLANALRGVFPDTERARQIPDADLIEYAKQAFDQRQAHLEKVRSKSPEDNVRAMRNKMRQAGISTAALAAGTAAGSANAASITRPEDTIRQQRSLQGGWLADQMAQQFGTYDQIMAAQPEKKPSQIQPVKESDSGLSMAISPAEWDAYRQQQIATGVEDPEHRQFKQNVAEVMQQPLIRVGAVNDREEGAGLYADGDDYDRITPTQFVGEYLDIYQPSLTDEQRAQVVQRVAAKLDGSTQAPDDIADDITDRMLTAMTASAPKGKWAKDDPMPQEQLDSLRQQYGDWADSMLTAGSAENFETLRGLELLRAAQDGRHAPVYANSLSNAAAFVKGFVDPQARKDFSDLALSSGPAGRFAKANRDFFASRPRYDEPAAFRNQDGSSRFAATSTSNIDGLMRAGSDTSTTLGWAGWPLHQFFAEYSRTPVGKAFGGEGASALWSESGWSDWNHMANQRNAFDREQQVIPAGMSREEFARQRDAAQQDREKGEGYAATLFPKAQSLYDPNAPKTWGPPLFNDYGPKFLQNTVGNIPSLAIMGASAATGGLAGLAGGAFKPAGSSVRTLINAGMGLGKGVAKGAGAAVGSQIDDLPMDAATDLAGGSALAGWNNYRNYLVTPEKENALLPDVDPNSMSLEELDRRRQQALDEREQQFQSNKYQWGRQ